MDAVYIFACIIIFLLALYWLGTYHFKIIKSFNIPGSKPWPFVGNLPDVLKYGGMVNLLQEYRKRYGNVFYLCVGQKTFVVVADPELLKLITVKEFEKFRDRSGFKLPPPNDTAVGIAQGADWKRVRSTLTPTFSGAKMKQMVPLVNQSCEILIEKFRKAAKSGKTVDASSFCQQYALEVLMSNAFGLVTNVQNDPNEELVKKVTQIMKNRLHMQWFIQCLPFYSLAMSLLIYVNKAGLRIQYLNNIAYDIIEQRKSRGIDIGRKDLMHLMLTTTDSEGKRKLTDSEITAQSVTFLMAGLHTTSFALRSFLHYLASFPESQEKLYDEIEKAFQADPNKPIYDLVLELQYLNCFFNEMLRITLRDKGAITRKCNETCTLNGVHFPKGTPVILSYFLAHYDPDAWSEPLQFNPERFRSEASEQRHPYQFNPFGAGPRNCIGMRLAQMETKITVVRLLREFKFVIAPESKPSVAYLLPEIVELRVESRNKMQQ